MKKIKRTIVTCHNLGEIILNEGIVPTPIYTNTPDTKYIVAPRTFRTNQKVKIKKPPKF